MTLSRWMLSVRNCWHLATTQSSSSKSPADTRETTESRVSGSEPESAQ